MNRLFFLISLITVCSIRLGSANELTLEQAFQMGLKNSPEIQTLKANYYSTLGNAQAQLARYDWGFSGSANYREADLTRVSVFLPSHVEENTYAIGLNKFFSYGTTVDIQANLLRSEDNSSFSTLNKRYETEAFISLSQPLLQGFGGKSERARLVAAQARLEAVNLAVLRGVEEYALGLAVRYWELWAQTQLVQVAEESEEDARQFLNETKRLDRIGLRERDDVDQAEAEWLQRQIETMEAKTNVENGWRLLFSYIGLPADEGETQFSSLSQPNLDREIDLDISSSDLGSTRNDLKAAEIRKKSNQLVLESLGTNQLPELNITGGYSLLGLDPSLDESVEETVNGKFSGWNIGLVLRHRFGQNADKAELSLAAADFYQAEADLKNLAIGISSQLKNRTQKFEEQKKKTALFEKIETKRKSVSNAFNRDFNQGRASTQEKLRANEDYRRTRYQLKFSQARLAIEWARLKVAQGLYLNVFGVSDAKPADLLGWDQNE